MRPARARAFLIWFAALVSAAVLVPAGSAAAAQFGSPTSRVRTHVVAHSTFGMRAPATHARVFGAPAPVKTSTPASTALSKPASGAYLGIFSALPGLTPAQSVSERESELGRTFKIDSHYYDWSDSFPGPAEKADAAAGRVPMVTWWGIQLSSITNGSNDSLIRARAQAVKAYGKPIFLRWGAEMNGNWYSWSGPSNGNDPAVFVAAWRHIHDIFTSEGVNNVAWVWAPNADSHPGGTDETSWNNWRHYYPGDAYVDWVGIDGYNWGSQDSWQSPGSIFNPVYNDYAGRKPIMVAETGSVESGGSKAAWITSLEGWMTSHTGAAALVWFDTNLSSSKIDWRIDSSASAFTAFRSLAQSSYFAR